MKQKPEEFKKEKKERLRVNFSLIFNTNQFTNYPYIKKVEQTRQPVYETGPILNVLKSKNQDYQDTLVIKPKYEKENGSDSDSDFNSEYECK